jgi:hypothetical protein
MVEKSLINGLIAFRTLRVSALMDSARAFGGILTIY